MKQQQPRRNASMRRDYVTSPPDERPQHLEDEARPSRRRARPTNPSIRELQPLIFYADVSDLDVNSVHVFDIDGGVALGLVTRSGTVNLCLPTTLARQLIGGLMKMTGTTADDLAQETQAVPNNDKWFD